MISILFAFVSEHSVPYTKSLKTRWHIFTAHIYASGLENELVVNTLVLKKKTSIRPIEESLRQNKANHCPGIKKLTKENSTKFFYT